LAACEIASYLDQLAGGAVVQPSSSSRTDKETTSFAKSANSRAPLRYSFVTFLARSKEALYSYGKSEQISERPELFAKEPFPGIFLHLKNR